MALSDEVHYVTKALTGLGVDEKLLITVLGKWQHEERKSFRKGNRSFFVEDERSFERLEDAWVKNLQKEFLRFQNAFVMWTMHPFERDARLAQKALKGVHSYVVLIEIACSRSSDELLGARRAYHSLFDRSIEEDVAHHVKSPECKLLVALVSAYRYEGPKVKDDTAKSDAKILANAIKNGETKKSLVEDDEIIRILSTRSKLHLKEVYEQYKKISGKNLDEDFADLSLKETVVCLCAPQKYFAKVLDTALKNDAHKSTKKALTRVVVTRAGTADMKSIREEFQNLSGVALSKKIEDTANGNFKDLLLALIS